jgi:hypothetical protein
MIHGWEGTALVVLLEMIRRLEAPQAREFLRATLEDVLEAFDG